MEAALDLSSDRIPNDDVNIKHYVSCYGRRIIRNACKVFDLAVHKRLYDVTNNSPCVIVQTMTFHGSVIVTRLYRNE